MAGDESTLETLNSEDNEEHKFNSYLHQAVLLVGKLSDNQKRETETKLKVIHCFQALCEEKKWSGQELPLTKKTILGLGKFAPSCSEFHVVVVAHGSNGRYHDCVSATGILRALRQRERGAATLHNHACFQYDAAILAEGRFEYSADRKALVYLRQFTSTRSEWSPQEKIPQIKKLSQRSGPDYASQVGWLHPSVGSLSLWYDAHSPKRLSFWSCKCLDIPQALSKQKFPTLGDEDGEPVCARYCQCVPIPN